MGDIKKKLKKLQDEYEGAEAAEPSSFKGMKDGDYVCKIKSMEVEEAKSSGRLQVKVVYEVVEPEKHEGVEIWDLFL